MSCFRSSLDTNPSRPTRSWWSRITKRRNEPPHPCRPPISSSAWSAQTESPYIEPPPSTTAAQSCKSRFIKETTEFKELSQLYIAHGYPKPIQAAIPAFEVVTLHGGEVNASAKNGLGSISPSLVPSGITGLYDRTNSAVATMFMGRMVVINEPVYTTGVLQQLWHEDSEVLLGNPTEFHKKDDRNWSMKAKWTGVLLPDCPGEESCASCWAVEDP